MRARWVRPTPARSGPSLVAVVNRFPAPSETFIVRKLEALHHRGFDVAVVARDISPRPRQGEPSRSFRTATSFGTGGGPLATTRRLGGAGAVARTAQRQWRGRFDPRAILLAAPILGLQPDIVHFEFSGIGVSYLAALALLRPARLVVSCRGAAEQITPLMQADRSAQLARLFGTVDLIHCVSSAMAETVTALGAPPDKILVNRPAVDVRRYGRPRGPDDHPAPTGPLRLLSVGRLHWKKGLDVAIEAVRRVVTAGGDVSYRIAGAGPEQEKLRYMITASGLDDRVELLGEVEPGKIAPLLNETDIFLLPSLSEGLSNAALEAMASSLPVIATTAGGMGEAIEDGRSGVLVPPASPDALATAVLDLCASPGGRRTLGAGARRRVQASFSLDRQAAAFDAAYRDLLRASEVPERTRS